MSTRRVGPMGFTLIELMLVVAIVGLVATIAIPKFGNMIDKSIEASYKGNLAALRSALLIYYADNDGIYPRYNDLQPNLAPGLFALHGKYADFERIKFRLPRYLTRHYVGSLPYSYSAYDWYLPDPRPEPGSHVECFKPGCPPIPTYGGSFMPVYWIYTDPPVFNRPPIAVKLGAQPLVPGPIVDLSGRAWSIW